MGKIAVALLAAGLLASGCATTPVSPNAVALGVEFQFGVEHRCSNTSPELRVSNLPAGVKELRVRLDDLDVSSWDHGGGTVASDGTGVIAAGALKQGYNGPCPPSGSHRYQFTVQAVDGAGVIVGQGTGMRVFP